VLIVKNQSKPHGQLTRELSTQKKLCQLFPASNESSMQKLHPNFPNFPNFQFLFGNKIIKIAATLAQEVNHHLLVVKKNSSNSISAWFLLYRKRNKLVLEKVKGCTEHIFSLRNIIEQCHEWQFHIL